jgi:uncharacterized membrane protein YjjP (DUF1212 family)
MLLLSGGLLALLWVLVAQSQPEVYEFALGAMILLQLEIHIRHLRNLFLFRAINCTDAIRGRIEYSRTLLLRMSSSESLAFSGLFFVTFMFTLSWFILGGAISSLSLAMKHRKLANKQPSNVTAAVQASNGT